MRLSTNAGDIWTGLAAHRPLSNINCARNEPTGIPRNSASATMAAPSTSQAPTDARLAILTSA